MKTLERLQRDLETTLAKAKVEYDVQYELESKMALKQQKFMSKAFEECLDEGDIVDGRSDYFTIRRKDEEGHLRDIIDIRIQTQYTKDWDPEGKLIHLSCYSSNDTSDEALTRAITIGKMAQVLKDSRVILIGSYNKITESLRANHRIVQKQVWGREQEIKELREVIVIEKVNIVMEGMREGKDIENRPTLWYTNTEGSYRVNHIKILSSTPSGKSHEIQVTSTYKRFDYNKNTDDTITRKENRKIRHQNLITFIKQHVMNDKA